MFISRITVQLDTHNGLTFADFHNLLNVSSPGLQLDRDIITNPNATQGFYITGTNPRASRAIGLQALHYNIPVVRCDITFLSVVDDKQVERAEYLDYAVQRERLKKHLHDQKYQGLVRDFTRFDVAYFVMGGDKSVKQLELSNCTEAPIPVKALQIVWRLRNNWAKEAWSFVQRSGDIQEGVDNAFCATTNAFLGPDWFHLGHNQELFLDRHANSTPKEVAPPDWRLLIDRAFEEAKKVPGATCPFDTCTMMADYLYQHHADEIA